MKRIDYRPPELRTMDPSYRYNLWRMEKVSGHLFADSRRIATLQAAVAALVVGGLYGYFFVFAGKTDKQVNKLLTYGPDEDKVKKLSK